MLIFHCILLSFNKIFAVEFALIPSAIGAYKALVSDGEICYSILIYFVKKWSLDSP